MVEMTPNTTKQQGVVALFKYKKSGLQHFAVVEWVFSDGSLLISECNYNAGECGTRHIPSDYKNLIGFYDTNPNPPQQYTRTNYLLQMLKGDSERGTLLFTSL